MSLQAPGKDVIATLPVFPGLGLESIVLPATPAQIAEALAFLKTQSHLGFDTESKPTFRKGEVSDGPHLVQFAAGQRAWLFQTRQAEAQAAVADLLHDAGIAKVGFGLANDTSQLAHKFAIHPQNLVDLDRHFRLLGYRNAVGAKGAIAILFKQRFAKSKSISTSNWAVAQLSDRQRQYAANDAYAALRVYEAMHATKHEPQS